MNRLATKREMRVITTLVTNTHQTRSLATSPLLTPDRTAGGRVHLPPVVLDALGQLDEGGVAGEAALGPGR